MWRVKFEFVKSPEVTLCGWRGYKPSIFNKQTNKQFSLLNSHPLSIGSIPLCHQPAMPPTRYATSPLCHQPAMPHTHIHEWPLTQTQWWHSGLVAYWVTEHTVMPPTRYATNLLCHQPAMPPSLCPLCVCVWGCWRIFNTHTYIHEWPSTQRQWWHSGLMASLAGGLAGWW